MVSDAVANASLPVFLKDYPSAKKKKTSRLARLKQSKLDVRREQWLSQAKVKIDKCEANNIVAPPALLLTKATKHQAIENQQGRTERDDDEVLSIVSSESECAMSSSSVDTLSLHDDSVRKEYQVCGSISSSSGSCSVSAISDEDGDNGCFDDWEALADALNDDNDLHTLPCKEWNHNPKPDDEQGFDHTSISFKAAAEENAEEKSAQIENPGFTCCKAWSPIDTSRPTNLPNISRKHYVINSKQDGDRVYEDDNVWSNWRSIVQQASSCPICCEDLDLTDTSFLPCPCGFRLCLFCHNRILEADVRCPSCRRTYV